MKKLILFLTFAALIVGYEAKAQGGSAYLFPKIAGDTISTTAALDSVTKIINATAGYSSLGIQVNATKISGTVTAKAYLYSSLDGVLYNITDSATAFANAAGAQAIWFTKTTVPYSYYKVQVRNVGTVVSTEAVLIRVYYTLRKYDRTN